MQIELKYGTDRRKLEISDQAEVDVLQPIRLPVLADPVEVLKAALDAPLGGFDLSACSDVASTAIAVPDETRPTPFQVLLPVLLDRVYAACPKLKPENVTIVVGGGLHPPMTVEAVEKWFPRETAPGCRVIIHDANRSPVKDYGLTRRGTPVAVNAGIAEADLKMAIGQVDPHQFVGFTGGAKGVVVGCASAAMIESNHSLMFVDGAEVGRLDGNPVREDLNEAGRMVGVDLAVNVVLDPSKNVVGLWAGEPEAVLRRGAEICAGVYGVPLDQKYDMAVISCGGAPKDICLYQAQKGLNLSSRAVKPGGKILLLAECGQGVGDDIYYDYACRFDTADAAQEDFKKSGFTMGRHKAYLFGLTLTRYEVVMESELKEDVLNQCYLTAGNGQAVLDAWIENFPGRPRIAVIPDANTTYFHPA